MIKNTPEGHSDRPGLLQAFQGIEEVVKLVNEGTREASVTLKLLGLQNRLVTNVSRGYLLDFTLN